MRAARTHVLSEYFSARNNREAINRHAGRAVKQSLNLYLIFQLFPRRLLKAASSVNRSFTH